LAKIKDLSVSFLSLVAKPATGKGLTLKAADGQRPATFDLIVKNDDMQRAFGIVYAPDQEDAHGDTADALTIRRAAAEFMREGRLKNIDTEHSFTTEMAFVAETWLVRQGDKLFPDEPEGSWAVGIQINDPDLWSQLKSGTLTGISLAGIARREPEPDDPGAQYYTEKDTTPNWVTRLMKALTGANTQETVEETDMTKDEVQALVGETLKSVLPGALKDAMKTAGDPPDPPATTEPTEVEKAVVAALKAAGVAPKEPKADPTDGATDIAKAVDAAVEKALGTKVTDAITKALAKGATETDPAVGEQVESFV
jgi:hypothetical protein